MIKFYFIIIGVICSNFTYAVAGYSLNAESFAPLGESVLVISDIGKVATKSYQSKTQRGFSLYIFPRKYHVRATGRYFADYLSQHGYEITDWYALNSDFVLNVVKKNLQVKEQKGVVVLDAAFSDSILGVMYLIPVEHPNDVINWRRSTPEQIALAQEVESFIAFTKSAAPKPTMATTTSVKSKVVTIKPPQSKINFMDKGYQLKDSSPMTLSPGYRYEFLPSDQNFGSWRNLITMQIMPPLVEPTVLAQVVYSNAKKKKGSIIPKHAVVTGKSGEIYVVCYLTARASAGNGEVYVTTKGSSVESVLATSNLNETKSDLILELNVHKIYRDKQNNNNLVNLFYAERRYGKVSESQFNALNSRIPEIIKQLEVLQIEPEVHK